MLVRALRHLSSVIPPSSAVAARGGSHRLLRSCSPGSAAPLMAAATTTTSNSKIASSISSSSGYRSFASASAPAPVSSVDQQQAQWNLYLATGRGSVTLFASIDSNNDGKLSVDDIKTFLKNIKPHHGCVSKKAKEALEDPKFLSQHIDLHEFQYWLLLATRDEGYTRGFNEFYAAHPDIGERAEQAPPLAPTATAKTTAVESKRDKYHHNRHHAWNASTMSQSLRRMQYAVRGEVVMKADAMAAQGREIIYTNIGNPHAVGQSPITYYRQVLALCDLPAECGVDHPNVSQLFPADVIARAKELRVMIGPSGTGAYTNSQGIAGFRRHVADFIERRDSSINDGFCIPAYPGNIFLTDGASSGIEFVLTALISSDEDAIMIPIPQYPIYSALITRLGGHKVGYYLDESKGWGVTREELELQLQQAKDRNLNVKGLALINPGNPTGQVMDRGDLELICQFCAEHGIVLLADEVYQRNVYAESKQFISTKKVAVETPGCETLELISFHSTSKGIIGECGRRGGYMELHGIDSYVQSQIYKLASSGLCSGVAGQVMTSLMVHGPQPGEESYDLFNHEEKELFNSLARRAKSLVEGLNAIDGMECTDAEGAMYAFPQITDFPAAALAEANANGQAPDTLYALSLLEQTGICVVPASGFGQKEGRIGFRTTFLPPEEQLDKAIRLFGEHHQAFCDKYAAKKN